MDNYLKRWLDHQDKKIKAEQTSKPDMKISFNDWQKYLSQKLQKCY